MARIFISYRDDSVNSAGRLGHLLGARFGSDHVFMADSTNVGTDAVAATIAAVGNCDVLVAVISPSWLTSTDNHGHRSIDRADDLVAVAIATALRRHALLFPVLVDGARMPAREEMPERVRALSGSRALRLDHMSFRSDAEQLINAIEATLPRRVRPRRRPRLAARPLVSRRSAPPSDRPVPMSRAIRRIALWWAIFFLVMPMCVGLFGLSMHSTPESIGVILIVSIQALILTICVLALRREILGQRRLVAQSVAGEEAAGSYRPVSSGRIWVISIIIVLIGVFVGLSVATSDPDPNIGMTPTGEMAVGSAIWAISSKRRWLRPISPWSASSG